MLIHLDLSRSRLWGLVTGKQFDPGQARETRVDLVPNHFTSVTGVKAWSPAFSLSRLMLHIKLKEITNAATW